MSDFIDRAQHDTEAITGEAKQQIGAATGDDEPRVRGDAQKSKSNVHQAVDTVSDVASDAAEVSSEMADTASKAAATIAGSVATTSSDVADSITELADGAAAKVRNVDVEVVVDTTRSPRTMAIAAATAGAVLAAVVIGLRRRRQRSRQVLLDPKRAVRALAQSIRSKSIFGH